MYISLLSDHVWVIFVILPVRVHANLSLDCNVLSWAQPFEYTAFVREALKYERTIPSEPKEHWALFY